MENKEVATKTNHAPVLMTAVETALVTGDLAKLTSEQRVNYYNAVCESVGLNPLTRPFEFITLNGKLTLYARREATDQLRKLHKVNVEIKSRDLLEGILTITTKVSDGTGRSDEASASVNIKGLQGEPLANAHMKCETKSKRRATLSFCGLGVLDETEIESIPESRDIKPHFEVANNVVAIEDAKKPAETAQPPAAKATPEKKEAPLFPDEPKFEPIIDDQGFQADPEKPFVKNKVADPKPGEMVFACWVNYKDTKLKDIPKEALDKMVAGLAAKAKTGAKFPAEWETFYTQACLFLNIKKETK